MDPVVWLIIGLIMIFLEFFIPGAVMGVAGALFVVVSLTLFALQASSPIYFLIYLALVIFLLYAVFKFAIWRIRSTRGQNTLYLDADQEGYIADSYDKGAIGKEGAALTDLRPAGRISVEGKTYQAMTQGGFIGKGSAISVIGGEGATLVVKQVNKEKPT